MNQAVTKHQHSKAIRQLGDNKQQLGFYGIPLSLAGAAAGFATFKGIYQFVDWFEENTTYYPKTKFK